MRTDPIGLAGGLNLYQYARANPVNAIDPWGLEGLADGGYLGGNYFNRKTHYCRNKLNQIVSYEIATKEWDGSVRADYHRQGFGNAWNEKYVSPDGHFEVVFTSNGKLVNDPVNRGTYNYVDSRRNPIGHFIEDVLPYYVWGNSADDPTTFIERLFGTYNQFTDGPFAGDNCNPNPCGD